MAKARAEAMRQAKAAEASVATQLKSASTRLNSTGRTLTRNVSVPLLAIGGYAVKSALDFNKAMTLIQTQAGASSKEVDKMRVALLDFAKSGKTAFGPTELAQGLYAIESAGIHGAKALETLKKASNLAMIGNTDLASTTKALAAAQKTGIKGSKNLDQAIGTLNATVGAGQMHMEDLLAAMGTGFLSSAKQLGLSLTDVGAALDEMTKQGIPAEAAATRLRMALTLMAAPSGPAIDALKGINLSADDLAITMRTKGLLPALQMLHDHLQGLSKVQQTQALTQIFGGARSATAILTLVNNLGDVDKTMQAIHDHAGEVNKDLQKARQTKAEELQIEWAKLQGVFTDLGDKLLPVVIPLLQDAGKTAEVILGAFASMPPFARELLIGAIAVGPLLRMAGAFASIAASVIRIAKGEAALSVLGLTGGGAAAAGGVTAGEAAAGGAAATGLLSRMRAVLGKGGKLLGVAFAANIVLSTIDELHREADQHSEDFRKAIEAFAGQQDTSTIGGFGKAFLGLPGEGNLTSVGDAAKRLQDLLSNTDAYKRATEAQKKYMLQLAREIGLSHEAQVGLRKYLDTVKSFPIGGGPIDWLKHLDTLQEAAMVSTGKTRKEMLRMATEALHSGQITTAQFDQLKQTISQDGAALSKTWHRAMATLGPDARKAAKDSSDPIETAIKGLRQRYGDLVTAGAHMSKSQRDDWKQLASTAFNNGEITRKQLDLIDRAMTNSRHQWEDNLRRIAHATNESMKTVQKTVGDTRVRLSKDYHGMVQVGTGAFTSLVSNTNSLAHAMGIKDVVKWRASSAVTGAGGVGHRAGLQEGGVRTMGMVPGSGSGDKVPVHVAGRLVAMTEPGELFGVLNRSAAQDWMAWNQIVPRAQEGTVLRLASGGALAGVKPATAALAHKFLSSFGGYISSGLRPGDPGFHGRGEAFDWVGGNWTGATQYANQIGRQLLEGIHQAPPGTNVSWDSGHQVPPSFWGAATWAEHVSHVHVAVAQAIKAAAMAELKRRIIEPQIAMAAPEQAALDRARNQLQHWLDVHAPRTGPEAMGLSIDGPVQKAFAEVAKRLSTSKVATLALGEAGYAESGMRDLGYGDASSEGALQLLASTAQSMGIDPHNEGEIASAFFLRGFYGKGGANKLADQGLPAYLVAEGVQGSSFSSGSNYADQEGPAKAWMNRYGLKEGGFVDLWGTGLAHFAKGGAAGPGGGRGGSPPTHADGSLDLGKFLRHYGKIGKRRKRRKRLSQLLEKIKDLGLPQHELDKISGLDRDVQIYEDLASRAADLTGDGPPRKVPGPGGDLDQAGWLNKELGALWELRQSLIRAQDEIAAIRKRIQKQIDNATKRLRELRRDAHKAKVRMRKLRHGKNLSKAELGDLRAEEKKAEHRVNQLENKKHLTKAEQDELKHLREADKRRQRMLQSGKRPSGERLKHLLDSMSERQHARNLRIDALGGDRGIIGALTDRRGKLASALDNFMGLDDIQGIGSPRDLRTKLASPVDPRFGGELLSVQLELRDLGKPSGALQGLDVAGLQEFAKLVQVGAFATDPFGTMPTFHLGGVLGEERAFVGRVGEGIFTPEQMAALAPAGGEGDLYIDADFYVGGEKIDERVEMKVRKVERRKDRDSRRAQRQGVRLGE